MPEDVHASGIRALHDDALRSLGRDKVSPPTQRSSVLPRPRQAPIPASAGSDA
jgi:hypothetical protein